MGNRPGASPPLMVVCWREQLAVYRTCSLGWPGAPELGQNCSKPLPSNLLSGQRLVSCQFRPPFAQSGCPSHSILPMLPGWASQGWRAASSSYSPGTGSTTQPLGPASPLKLSQSFLFGAGDAKALPPPLFCRDHRSICCPHGGAPRQYHTGAAPQKTLLAAFLIGSKVVPAAG